VFWEKEALVGPPFLLQLLLQRCLKQLKLFGTTAILVE
jgi:hypothetical protein